MDATTIVCSETSVDSAKRAATTRTITTVAEDQWRLVMYRSIEGAPEYTHVEAILSRASAEPVVVDATDMERHQPGLEALKPLVGKWEITGRVIPMPGMEAMDISGTESVVPILRGNIIESRVVGRPGDYEAIAMFCPNRVTGAFHHVTFDNMGTFTHAEGHAVDGAIIVTYSGTLQGTPYAERTVVVLGEDGPEKVTTNRFTGTGAGEQVFEATYKKAE